MNNFIDKNNSDKKKSSKEAIVRYWAEVQDRNWIILNSKTSKQQKLFSSASKSNLHNMLKRKSNHS